MMESIQRLVTRMVNGMRDLPYESRLRRMSTCSLERRWLRGDIILAYNTFHGRFDLPQAVFSGSSGTIPSRTLIKVAPPALFRC